MCSQHDEPSGYAPQGYYDPIETPVGVIDHDDPREITMAKCIDPTCDRMSHDRSDHLDPDYWTRERVCESPVPAYDATLHTSRCLRCGGEPFHESPRTYTYA